MQYLCETGDLRHDSGQEVLLEGEGPPRYVAVFLTEDGPRAYMNVCPHQGRSLCWAPGQFLFSEDHNLVCPHHGACFETATGLCISGPCAGASLSSLPIEVRDGSVYFSGTRD